MGFEFFGVDVGLGICRGNFGSHFAIFGNQSDLAGMFGGIDELEKVNSGLGSGDGYGIHAYIMYNVYNMSIARIVLIDIMKLDWRAS